MKPPSADVAFEFIAMGRYVKVSAIDMATGREVSIVGDAAASEAVLQRIVLAKLRKTLKA
ncbi:MAG: DUF6898 family protein [Alphaproteobacteria bacterium]